MSKQLEHEPVDAPLGTEVDRGRRQVMAMLALSGLASPWDARAAQPSAPLHRVLDFDWVDMPRSRAVPARLYWPLSGPQAAPMPLVVFSHGIGGTRYGYSYLGKHLSAHGMASLHVQHVGSDSRLWRGNPFGVVGRLQAAAQELEAIARAADVRFALDQVLSGDLARLGITVDRSRIVAAGHSYGANTTLLAVGARVVRKGRTIDCLDPRFSAAVVISAPPFYGERDLSGVLGQVSVPSLHVTATRDMIEIPGYRSGVEDRVAVFEAIDHPQKLLAVFDGGSHSMFTDRPFTGGIALNGKVKIATAELVMAFMDGVFQGDGAALVTWQATWHSILARTAGSAVVS